jgi:DNA-binding PadR family transcriptional regulator
MKIVGILKDKIIIEPQYGGDNETYIQLTEKGMEELRSVFNVKQYNSMEDFHADYYYGISEKEYIENIRKSNALAQVQREASKPIGNIESNFMEDYINDVYEQNDDIPF